VIEVASYWYWSKRTKPIMVKSENELPAGEWATVTEAAKVKKYSRQTIYMRFYTKQCDGYVVGDGPLLVNLDQIK